MDKKKRWTAAKSFTFGQGIVTEESTGRTVAVAYDDKDTALLAAAPLMLEVLEEINCNVRAVLNEDLRRKVIEAIHAAGGE